MFHDDWNNVDDIMADSDVIIDANTFHTKLLLGALQHAVPLKTFRNRLYWVTIYQVQHRKHLCPGVPGSGEPGQCRRAREGDASARSAIGCAIRTEPERDVHSVPANGCATRNIRSAMLAMANKSGGLMVTSDQPIVVERVHDIAARRAPGHRPR